MKQAVLEAITGTGMIAIMRGLTLDTSLQAAGALIAGGVKALEVTYNTPGAERILTRLAQEYGTVAYLGAGTVTTEDHLNSAIQAGASFILGPHFDKSLVKKTVEAGLVSIPGAFTATEVLEAYKTGGDIIKVFPASSVGPQYIKDLKGPFDHIPLMPVGGVDLHTAPTFIKAGSTALGVGSSLLSKELISQGEWAKLTALAAEYLRIIKEVRQ